MIAGHGGNVHEIAGRIGCAPADITDMSSNMNPLGPPPGLMRHLYENLDTITSLPQVDAGACVKAFADRHGLDPETVLAGNGTTQFIYTLPAAIGAGRMLIVAPTYADYADGCRMHRIPCEFFILRDRDDFVPDAAALEKRLAGFDTAVICNPNNPTGVLIPRSTLHSLCEAHPEKNFIIDESYMPFVPQGEGYSMAGCGLENVIVLNSMSKIFRLPGLRIGFIVASRDNIGRLRRYMMPWNVNSLAQKAILYLMNNQKETGVFVADSRRFLAEERDRLYAAFGASDRIRLFPSRTSYILCRLSPPHTAASLCRAMLEHRILLRNAGNFEGLSEQYVRISLKSRAVNEKLCRSLEAVLEAGR